MPLVLVFSSLTSSPRSSSVRFFLFAAVFSGKILFYISAGACRYWRSCLERTSTPSSTTVAIEPGDTQVAPPSARSIGGGGASAGGGPGGGGGGGGGGDGSDYRVAVFGAGGVGKSSLSQRFVNGTFSDNYVPTIEDTYRQVISCNQKSVCTLQITDTTGSHQFPAMQRLSISKGHAFVLVYSVTSMSSLEELVGIIKMLKEGEALMETPIMLVGNKCDEPANKRQVSKEQGERLSTKWGVGFIETSAKSNENVTELFQKLLTMEKKRSLALTSEDTDGKAGKKRKCSLM